MTDEERKTLVKKLLADKQINKDFNSRLDQENRRWFMDRIIRHYQGLGAPDSRIELITREIVKETGVIVAAREKKGFSTGTLHNKWSAFKEIVSRIQIIYGAIAVHPKLGEPAHASYLDFIVERRYRMIKRMVYSVNPNEVRNVFAYPDDTCKDFKVNKSAFDYWITHRVSGGLQLPYGLSIDGKSYPALAVEKIFNKHKDCDRNMLTCDYVATVLQIDSLLEAKDKDKFMKALATENDNYIHIDHPFSLCYLRKPPNSRTEGKIAYLRSVLLEGLTPGNDKEVKVARAFSFLANLLPENNTGLNDSFYPLNIGCYINQGNVSEKILIIAANPVQQKIRIKTVTKSHLAGAKIYDLDGEINLPYHFLTDSRPDKANFEQIEVNMDEVQVGDHIYVANHPLYHLLYSSGIWGGEHSFVTQIGSRNIKESAFDASFSVMGHGLNGDEANTRIKDRDTIKLLGEGLLNKINSALPLIQEIVKYHLKNREEHDDNPSPDIKVVDDVWTNNKGQKLDVRHYIYNKKLSLKNPGTGRPEVISNGFITMRPKDVETEFHILTFVDTDAASIKNNALVRIVYINNVFDDKNQFRPENWGFRVLDNLTGKWGEVKLFKGKGTNLKPTKLVFSDLKAVTPFYKMTGNKDLFVIRPRVDFSPAYQNYLKNNGAI